MKILDHSLTEVEQARLDLLEPELKEKNHYRKQIGLNNFDHSDYIKNKYNLSLYDYLNKPLSKQEILIFYNLTAKYKNNVRV